MNFQKVSVSKIPERKLKQALKKGLMTLTAKELEAGSYQMYVHPMTKKQIDQSKKKGKGVRLIFTPQEILESLKEDKLISNDGSLIKDDEMIAGSLSGGSVWKSIWGALKKAWPTVIRPALSAALDVGAPALGVYTGHPMGVEVATAAREGIRRLTGVGLKKHSNKLGKGTEAAKKHMAMLREKKKLKAASFRLN